MAQLWHPPHRSWPLQRCCFHLLKPCQHMEQLTIWNPWTLTSRMLLSILHCNKQKQSGKYQVLWFDVLGSKATAASMWHHVALFPLFFWTLSFFFTTFDFQRLGFGTCHQRDEDAFTIASARSCSHPYSSGIFWDGMWVRGLQAQL